MFHVLTEKAVPSTLYSGCTSRLINGRQEFFQEEANAVMCGAGVGERREAITYNRFNSLVSQGKLRVRQLCSACGRKLGIKKETNVTS